MESFTHYQVDLQKYLKLWPEYLRSAPSQPYRYTKLLFDIMRQHQATVFDLWNHFSMDTLKNEYTIWKRVNPSSEPDPWDGSRDAEWPYTHQVETLAKALGILRERTVVLTGEPTGVVLNNLQLLRLIKIRQTAKTFKGTKEEVNELYQNLFGSGFVFAAVTTGTAVAIIYLSVPVGAPWSDVDTALFEGGDYFFEILGISYTFTKVSSNALVYDVSAKYDTNGDLTELKYDQ